MSKKLFGKFFVFLLVVGLLFAVAPTGQAQAATICVNPGGTDGCYARIQSAIDAAASGDTIEVAAGTYSESQGGWRDLTISKSLSLIGAGSTQTIVKFTNLQHGLEIIPDATGTVLLQGITFTKLDANANSAGWAVIVGETGGTFQKITFSDVDISYASARNLHFNANTTYNEIVIENSKVHHSDIYGACIAGPTNKLTVTNSDFTNNGKDEPVHGYGLDLNSPSIQNATITGGHFDDNFGPGININSLTNATFDGVSASHNGNFNGSVADYEVGINLWDFTGSGSNNVVFKNSTFANNERAGVVLGNQTPITTGPVTIESSTITGNGRYGLIFWDTTNAAMPWNSISVHHNRIVHTGTSQTLLGNHTSGISLENNWWGCNEGFGQSGCSGGAWAMNGSFTVPTWLVMNVSAAPAFTPGADSTFTADLTMNNVGADLLGDLPPASVAFTPIANVAPDSALLALSKASTTFTAPNPPTSFDVCAVLDNETVCLPYTHATPTVTFADDSWVGNADGTAVTVGTGTHYIGFDAFDTIQEAIDAVTLNGTVNVLPGVYSETAANRTIDAGGTYQFGLFFDSAKPGITLQGVKADGSVITNAADVAAQITTNSTSNFGPDGVYVEANNTTITGLKFLDNVPYNNKTVTIVANNFTFKDNIISVLEGGSVYFDGTGVEAYNVSENLFKYGASLDISSGAGLNGLASGRVIADNVFTADGVDVYWASISFNGIVPGVGWFVNPVGGATITGNTFVGGEMPIRSRGIVEDDFDWASYITGNNFEKAVIAWDPIANKPRPYTYTTSGGVTINNTILIGTVIQDEIGHAQPGDEVRVIKGTFVEDVTVNKDITLKGIPDPFAVSPTVVVDGLITITADGATVTNLKVSPGAVTGQVAAISVYAGNTTVSGNLIDGMAGNGTASVKGIFVYGGSSTALTNITINGNTVKNISNTGKGTDGIQIQGVVDGVSVTNNTVQAISSTGWAFGIEVTPTGSFPTTAPKNITITGNTVDGVTATTYPGVALGIDAAGPGMANPADASQVMVHQNVFINYQAAASSKDPLHQLDATLNYWGSACGPAAGTVYGDVLVYPWNIDAIGTPMSTTPQTYNFTQSTGTAAINAAIACAPSNSTFNFAAGAYLAGFVVPGLGQDHQTLVLADNAVITATSPCFDVSADYTTIMAEHIGMAACVTAEGSNGIDVADGIRNLTVDGLEIYGPGNDGIHFAGVIRDVVLKDNYIHNLAGNGVFFGAQPEWIAAPEGIDIHGNLFQSNGGFGVTNPYGTAPIDATYNSWGDVAGPSAGDGVGPNVTATPFTHVDVYMVASGTPWTDIPLNQVVSGQQITFKVMAHVVNALTVDVKLAYPTNLINPSTNIDTTAFPSFAVADTTTYPGTIWFHGMTPAVGEPPSVTYPPITGTVELFTVTFTGGTPGLDRPMNLDELSDVFGMEGVGSSSNIYAVALLDSTVNVIALPVIDIVPVTTAPYAAGLPIEFNITVTNAGGGNFADLNLDFTLPTGAVLQYWDGDSWETVIDPMTIGDLATGGTAFDPVLPLFRVIFAEPPTGTISVALMDLAPATDFQLATTTETFTLLGNFTVTGTFSMQGRSTRAGIPVTLDYLDMVAYTDKTGTTINQISYNLVIPDVNGGHWQLTTLQPRYLNVIIENNKIVTVDGNETLIALQLKGGNAIWNDNKIDILDAGAVGTLYGTGTIADDADVNFDGKVNIQDLALVGGNFDLTSETAYGIGNGSIWTVQ